MSELSSRDMTKLFGDPLAFVAGPECQELCALEGQLWDWAVVEDFGGQQEGLLNYLVVELLLM